MAIVEVAKRNRGQLIAAEAKRSRLTPTISAR